MPQMGESITEGTLTKWLKKVGDTVQRDEPIFEISTDKVDAEIPSPVAGTLQKSRSRKADRHRRHRRRRHRGGAQLPLAAKVRAARPCGGSREHGPDPAQHPQRLPPQTAAKARAPRRSSARSPRKTTSISRRSPAPAPPAASPSRTSLGASRRRRQQPHSRRSTCSAARISTVEARSCRSRYAPSPASSSP